MAPSKAAKRPVRHSPASALSAGMTQRMQESPRTLEDLKREIAALEQKLEEPSPEAVRELYEARVDDMQRSMHALQELQSGGRIAVAQTAEALEGSVVSRIEFFGLSDEIHQQIAGKLPIKIGDILTHEKREGVTEAVIHQMEK